MFGLWNLPTGADELAGVLDLARRSEEPSRSPSPPRRIVAGSRLLLSHRGVALKEPGRSRSSRSAALRAMACAHLHHHCTGRVLAGRHRARLLPLRTLASRHSARPRRRESSPAAASACPCRCNSRSPALPQRAAVIARCVCVMTESLDPNRR